MRTDRTRWSRPTRAAALGAAACLAAAALCAQPAGAGTAALGQPAGAGTAAAARVQVAANARVVPGLGIQKTEDLDLGEVRPGAGPGFVRLELLPGSVSARSASGGVGLSGSFHAARFRVTSIGGGGASRLQVSLPASATLSRLGGKETMTVEGFQASLAPACASGPECAQAPRVLLVGVTLRIGAEQVAGNYAGTFTVTVNEF